jgi:hypothetical protein
VRIPVRPVQSNQAPVFRLLAQAALLAASVIGCGGDTSTKGTSFPAAEQVAGAGGQSGYLTTERAWLERVGSGPAQTARVCARGASDRAAKALCREDAAKIASLDQLYQALGLGPGQRRVAATTHSLALSGRTVSAANPRVMVMADNSAPGGLTYESIVVTAFSRGEQMVELAAVDPTTYEYNFYLLGFSQPCNQSRCTPEDLLSSRVETGWTGWTLYSDAELEDTPLDCLSCHRPFGPDSRKILQMRQDFDPWMHWGDFRKLDEGGCPSRPPEGVEPRVVAQTDGLDLLVTLEGPRGAYAGVPVTELRDAPSGDVMTDFMVDAENLITAAPIPPHPYAQFSLRTRETLCERFQTGQSTSWEEDRLLSQRRGLPFPYYAPDVLDPKAREQLLERPDFLRARSQEEAFDVLRSLLAPEVPAAVGFVPRESDSATEILQGMCSRCHAARTNPALARARFVVDTPTVSPAVFQNVRQRLSLPTDAPRAMPPRNAGEMPTWAVDRVLSHLADRCSPKGACL